LSLHHDIDPDLLPCGQDRLAPRKRRNTRNSSSRLMSRLLRDRGCQHAVQQQLARQDGHMMADEHHLLVAAQLRRLFHNPRQTDAVNQ
jgi:hypothetical protein